MLAGTLGLVAACGSGGEPPPEAAPVAPAVEVETPELAAASRPVSSTEAGFTILVTSPEGVDSPGLDAVVETLAGRPDTAVAVVAPAADLGAAGGSRAPGVLGVIDGETMSGHPARIVNGTVSDALVAAFDGDLLAPDLVVVGMTTTPDVGAGADSAAVAAARLAESRGIPALTLSTDDGVEPDFAGATRSLATVLDYEIDTVLTGAHRLVVPTCEDGELRGPVVVSRTSDDPKPTADCTGPEATSFSDDAAAYGAGYAVLAPVP